MGSRRKADDSARLLTVSRPTLIGAATVAPVLGGELLATNDTVARCAAWLALDLEIDRLAVRWSQLETLMARSHRWFALTPAERRALPEAAEMFVIDDTLEALSRQRERMLQPLSRLKADTLHGVASKLAVAARLLQHEDNPAQPFVASALRELADMGCPGCGAAYAPASVTRRR
ncbi:MAG: hypothetical protein Q8Q88_01090 [Phenylobacterium sp.]|uniref:hypothetical protein n=1 Tax=Phenylobacterium sp. TaxID=1871053 RepID=UPI0027353E21|nr:hypothetical protein [Phenylobacterium sp.]MDP3745620.1 hypothetical protein [Phenylobacterium sp.]